MPFDKIRDREGEIARLQIATTAQFVRDVFGNVFRPTFGGIEDDGRGSVVILAGEQVLN